ncbi:MAG TPA: gluconate 2-dehydrogenase subunit 3 family protein [Gemmatimonadales bacterium]|nr:gluconate 2-dehydrogenase subunit 3 family protein [Gemmatimonadales bacterium]
MDRRRALHVLGTGAMAGTALAGATPTRLAALAARAAGRPPSVLSPAQAALVAELGELILPETDTPGARAAEVERFVDLMLAEQVEEPARAEFLAFLDGIEAESARRFGRPLLGATPAERFALALERDASAFAAPPGDEDPDRRGWRRLKGWVLAGYYTSKVGALQELELRIIPGTFEGCAPLRPREGAR